MIAKDLKQLSEHLLQLSHKLKSALLHKKEHEANRFEEQIRLLLSGDDSYTRIYDEAILADVVHALKQYDEESFSDEYLALEEHLAKVHAIHTKLFCVLDPSLAIETLLYQHLNQWPLLSHDLDYVFETSQEAELQAIRKLGPRPETLQGFFNLYFQILDSKGFRWAIDLLKVPAESCIESFERLSKATLRGLFLVDGIGEVAEIAIKASPKSMDQPAVVEFLHEVDADMKNAAQRALVCARDIHGSTASYHFAINISRSYLDYGGNSIGLALGVAYIAETQKLPISPYVAFTGHLDFKTGKVTSVYGVEQKAQAAVRLGIRELFISAEDKAAVTEETAAKLIIRPVEKLEDAIRELMSRTYEISSSSLEAKIQKAVNLLKQEGLRLSNRADNPTYIRLDFWNGETVPVNIYRTQTPQVQGSDKLKHKTLVKAVFDKVFGTNETGPHIEDKVSNEKKHERIEDLKAEQKQRVRDFIAAQEGVVFGEEQHCDYVARITQGKFYLIVKQYHKGLLYLDGKDNPLFHRFGDEIRQLLGISNVEFEAKKNALTKLERQQAEVMAIDVGQEWIGTDESGKGDYFGPLVSAAVHVNHQIAAILLDLGVTDSKKLSDKRIGELAPQIEKLCGGRCTHVIVNPERYNDLYKQFEAEQKNLNSLLAWAHVKALENILSNSQPLSPLTVIIDKFADENYIQSRFKAEKLIKAHQKVELKLVQLPKAEVNVAVAAASIIARFYFLQQIKRLSQLYGFEMPKGSSDPNIVEIGKAIVKKHGLAELSKVAKLHFRTTGRILNG